MISEETQAKIQAYQEKMSVFVRTKGLKLRAIKDEMLEKFATEVFGPITAQRVRDDEDDMALLVLAELVMNLGQELAADNAHAIGIPRVVVENGCRAAMKMYCDIAGQVDVDKDAVRQGAQADVKKAMDSDPRSNHWAMLREAKATIASPARMLRVLRAGHVAMCEELAQTMADRGDPPTDEEQAEAKVLITRDEARELATIPIIVGLGAVRLASEMGNMPRAKVREVLVRFVNLVLEPKTQV